MSCPFGIPFRFSTKYTETESGLLYYGYRFCSPLIGRWISRDPSDENSGDSLYSFAGNNGVNSLDPNGLYQIDFHYYAIQYLLLAAGYDEMDSSNIAFWSQWVDDSPDTDPVRLGKRAFVQGDFNNYQKYHMLRLYHFPESSHSKGTPVAEQNSFNAMSYSLLSLQNDGADLVTLGANLHTFADTFAHKGFSAYYSSGVNGLSSHGWLGHYTYPILMPPIGHGMFGSRPDYPFLRPQLALSAAAAIYGAIPVASEACMGRKTPWSEISGDLLRLFSARGSELSRSQDFIDATRNRFGSGQLYRGSHDFQTSIEN
jgi:RHS repeat-associated protein